MSSFDVTPVQEPFSTGYIDGRMRARASQPIIGEHGYLTPPDEWGDVERGNPLPYTLPLERRLAVGLERETWRLEVIADPDSTSVLQTPLSNDLSTALDFEGLLRLGAEHGVSYLKGVTCNNLGEPLGMGLWEGVPLRVLVWMAQPLRDVRRVFYYGYHNDDPAQIFQSSLPIGRVLEDPPGELPVLVAYKLNGEFLTGKRGGPVRMVVPEAYGFKSVKWLQRVVLTNDHRANDTYHSGNNDLESPMKTFARFVRVPRRVRTGQPIEITGIAQAGVSGLARVQYWLHPKDEPLPADDPYFSRADWREAHILPPPRQWGGGLPADAHLEAPLQFDGSTPKQWPLRYTVVHWAATLSGLTPGEYELRCRTFDLNGTAQPMPRPFAKSGRAEIQCVAVVVEGERC